MPPAALALALVVSLAALAWDPRAEAADPKRALLLVVALGALVFTAARDRRSADAAPTATLPRAGVLALAFVAVSAVSALHGVGDALGPLSLLVAGVALALAARSLGRAQAFAALRISSLCISGVAAGITVVSALAGLRGFSLHGGQGNPNWLGLLLAIALPVVADFAFALHRRGRRASLFVAATVVGVDAVALGLSHSRVAWIACACGLLVLFARRHLGAVPLRRAALTLAAVGALVALPNLPFPTSTATKPAATTPSHGLARTEGGPSGEVDAGTSLRGRAWIARISVRAAVASFPLGVGLGGFGDVYLREQGEALSTVSPKEASRRFLNATTAHDDFLESLVVSGPLGLVTFAGALLVAVVAHLRGRTRAIGGALVAFSVCALGDSPLHQPAIVALLALAFATLPTTSRVGTALSSFSPMRARFALGLACALLLVTAGRTWLGTRTRVGAESLEPESRLAMLARAARIDPRSGENALALGLARLELDDFDGALVSLRRSLPLLPNVGTWVAIGNAELGRARPDLAELAYREALARDPGSRRAHADLAEALRRQGRLLDAERHAELALQLGPGDARVRALVDRIHKDLMQVATD